MFNYLNFNLSIIDKLEQNVKKFHLIRFFFSIVT